MSLIGGTPRRERHKIHLNGRSYHVLIPEEARDTGARAWAEQSYELQQIENTKQQMYNMGTQVNGAGLTFAMIEGTYERARGWDTAAPEKISSWPRRATGDPYTSIDYPARNIMHGGYNYWMRGAFCHKLEINDTKDAVWSIIETHYFGTSRAVVGRVERFKEKLYVPLIDTSTSTLTRFHELTTVAGNVVEQQTVQISGTPTGGTYTLSYNGIASTAIAWNADATAVQTALRTIPGWGQVTVALTAGSSPNVTFTITLTGVGAPLAVGSPSQLTSSSSLTGGVPVITHATTQAGTVDTWNLGDATTPAKAFRVWQEKLVRAANDIVSTVSDDPLNPADWGAEYTVTESGQHINNLEIWDKYLVCGCTDGIRTFDETLKVQQELPDLESSVDDDNCEQMAYINGWVFASHKTGLIQWQPGSYSFIGAEQEGALEGDRTIGGWGRVSGLVAYGKIGFVAINDNYHRVGTIMGFFPPTENRSPVTPFIFHQTKDDAEETFEALAILANVTQPSQPQAIAGFTDDSAIGTITWSNPSNVLNDDGSYATATVGTTHYLKGLDRLGPAVPDDADITGILVRIKRGFTPS